MAVSHNLEEISILISHICSNHNYISCINTYTYYPKQRIVLVNEWTDFLSTFLLSKSFFFNMKDHAQWPYGNGDCSEKRSMPVFPMSCLLPPHPRISQYIEMRTPPVKVKSLQTNSWLAVIWFYLVLNLETDYCPLLPLHIFFLAF